MPSSYTSLNRLEKQAAGENNNTWGTNLNANMIDMVDEALDGVTAFTLSGSKTLSTANGSTDESRARVLDITSGTGGTVTLPNIKKNYIVRNACSGAVTFTTGSGTTGDIAAGTIGHVMSMGSNVIRTVSFQPYAAAATWRSDLGLVRGAMGGFSGRPLGSQKVPAICPYALTLVQASCVAKAGTAATAQTIFTIKESGSSIGTCTFAASGTTGTFALTDTAIAANALITFEAPASRDATLADITILIRE